MSLKERLAEQKAAQQVTSNERSKPVSGTIATANKPIVAQAKVAAPKATSLRERMAAAKLAAAQPKAEVFPTEVDTEQLVEALQQADSKSSVAQQIDEAIPEAGKLSEPSKLSLRPDLIIMDDIEEELEGGGTNHPIVKDIARHTGVDIEIGRAHV